MDDILVEVICRLPDRELQTFNVATPERNTVAGLIRKVCKDNGIVVRTSYTLLDKHERVLQWSQTLKNCGIKHNDTVYLTNEDEDTHIQSGCSWNSWWFVAAISLLIGGVGCTAVTLLYTRNGQPQYQYGVVLDAGSSHTTVYVYKWNGEKLDHTAEARQIHECKVNGGGITSYESNPSDVKAPLQKCIDEVKHVIPIEDRDKAPIFLGATAGMRMLDIVNHDAADEILFNVRDVLQASAFSFTSPDTQARIITGQEEGTFGWITANYVSNKLAGMLPSQLINEDVKYSGEDTIGALDMGGASTQITFYTPQHANIPSNYKEDLVLYGQNYSVYTHSYLCSGINEAVRRYQAILIKNQGYNETNITNPCGPKGYTVDLLTSDIFEAPCVKTFTNQLGHSPQDIDVNIDNYTFTGTGEEEECIDAVKQLYNFTAPCPVPPCSFNGTYQPPVVGDFYAFSSFFYEMEFLNLTSKEHSLQDFTTRLSKLCNSSWDVVSKMPAGSNGTMLPWYCFEGHFIKTLLVDAYKFNDISWGHLKFVKKINETDIGWTLGYMLNSSNTIPDTGTAQYISTTAFSSLTVLFSIFILLSVGFGCHARKYQESKAIGLYERVPTYGAV
ncbi:Ectonucleoside triphosphate diphosphohydrolase 3 [Mactra antiquata]